LSFFLPLFKKIESFQFFLSCIYLVADPRYLYDINSFNSFWVASKDSLVVYDEGGLSILSELHLSHGFLVMGQYKKKAFNSFWVASGHLVRCQGFGIGTFNSFWVASRRIRPCRVAGKEEAFNSFWVASFVVAGREKMCLMKHELSILSELHQKREKGETQG